MEQAVAGAAATGRTAPFRIHGPDPTPHLRQFSGTLRSLPILDSAARGHGLLSVDPRGGVVRRVPLVASVAGVLTPALSIELLRIASDLPAFSITADGGGVRSIGVGDTVIPVNRDGTIWVHFSAARRGAFRIRARRNPRRHRSRTHRAARLRWSAQPAWDCSTTRPRRWANAYRESRFTRRSSRTYSRTACCAGRFVSSNWNAGYCSAAG